ncbi:MAG: CoB--CoM heterodisulfide reductase iron-sulfur subunit A family protein [Thermodesulfobacteriota bacterium]
MSLRIGVFVCHCGTNIGGVVDVEKVAEYARGLPNVAWAETNLYTCSENGLSSIREKIEEHHLNRVIVASCTPRTHEPLFKANCEKAGLNKYLFEFVNIREQCSWVHKNVPDDATEKAKDLVRMGVSKARSLEEIEDLYSDVLPSSLVLGGGISGLSAALSLANQGYVVELIEKKEQLGGLLRGVNRLFPTDQRSQEILGPLIQSVVNHEHIHIHVSTELLALKGFIGNFTATVQRDDHAEDLRIGTIIVATGGDELKPDGMFAYGQFDNVMTQLEFEQRYRSDCLAFNDIVMINCVGVRIDERPYCGRFCCITALKNALLLKEANPQSHITVLHRDIMATGKIYEDYYRKALAAGVRFIRYSVENPPIISGSNGTAKAIKVPHELTGRDISLRTDLVLLTTPLVPGPDNDRLSKMMKLPLGDDGFFLEAHQKLRPVEFSSDGIFIAGCARYPSEMGECTTQGLAAAAKAGMPMAQGRVLAEPLIAVVDSERCSSCGRCVQICPFGAADWKENRGISVAYINPAECKGCGLCSSSCLSGAIHVKGFSDKGIMDAISVMKDYVAM